MLRLFLTATAAVVGHALSAATDNRASSAAAVNERDAALKASDAALEELRSDFQSGALHPGDLKPFVTKAVDGFLQAVRDRCKAEEPAKKAEADVRAYLKKLAAASKKKK